MENFQEKWTLNEQKKQRINLSKKAYTILMQDMDCFGEAKNKSAFINRVLIEYSELSKAVCLTNAPRLMEKGNAFNITISSQAEELIYSRLKISQSEKYKSSGALIKAIIEEYCNLDLPQRERIFFAAKKRRIEEFMKNNQAFKVITPVGYCDLRAAQFEVDPITNYNYVICFSRLHSLKKENEIIVSMRLSRLSNDMRPISTNTMSGKITFLEKKAIRDALAKSSPAFIMNENTTIKVRFTQRGEEKYREIFHLRPQYTKKERGKVYFFECPLFQARSYFVRLGEDVEILEPKELRDDFAELYRKCMKVYE